MGGGLGNQLFKYAFARSLALQLKTDLKFDLTFQEKNKSSHHNYYKLDAYNIPQNFATPEEIASINPVNWKIMDKFLLPVNEGDNVYIKGSAWLQHEEFFIKISDVIRKEVTLKNPLTAVADKWKEKILSADCAVSLHVRLGDYMLLPSFRNIGGAPLTITFDYFDICINELKKITQSITLFVFSDDMKWCKDNLSFDFPIEFVEGCEYDHEDMYLMSLCNHNVIAAASTFSWWGAWLNQNPNKIVFIPPNGNGYIAGHTIIVPLDHRKRRLIEIPPVFSIIIYVENNSFGVIEITLRNILSQSLHDYEIILMDVSTDGSGEFCRKFTNNKSVTVINLSRKTKKFFAWNKALNLVNSDYIMFLTSKDFLFPQTIQAISKVYEQTFKQYANTREQYITYDNYDFCLPSIVCGTQMVEENEYGDININGIPNKKFSFRVDNSLQNLNDIAEIEIPNNQKLMALGSGGINNLVCTKFFKRKFLIENNIRFNENENIDAELTFVTESFLKTEKIVFVPQVFLGRFK